MVKQFKMTSAMPGGEVSHVTVCARALIGIALAGLALAGCGQGANSGGKNPVSPGYEQTGPTTMARGSRSFQTEFLLYSGNATWGPEVSALKALMREKGARFQEADASDLNQMSLDELSQFGAIVWPGGIGSDQVSALPAETRSKMRQAVQERGVGWIGFCAGSFVAVAPAPASPQQKPSYGIGVVAGPVLEYYYLENELHSKGLSDMTVLSFDLAGGAKRDMLWYGGPVVPETAAGVISRYPNGEPAISQTWSGNGFVILSAIHPAAPQSVKDSNGLTDKDGSDSDLAWALLSSVIQQKEMPKA